MFFLTLDLTKTQQQAIYQIGASAEVCRSETSCLCGLDTVDALHIISRLISDQKKLSSPKEKNDFIQAHIVRSFVGYKEKGYGKFNWTIGSPPHTISGCCRWCFQHFYQIGNTKLTELCKLVKESKVDMPDFSDRDAPYVYKSHFRNALDDMARQMGIVLNHRQIAAMQIPNTDKVIYIYMYIFLQFSNLLMCNLGFKLLWLAIFIFLDGW